MGGRGGSSGLSNTPMRILSDYNDVVDFFGVHSSDSDAMYPSWERNTTTAERGSVTEYTGSYYKRLNGILRSGDPASNWDKDNIKNIDRAIKQFDLKEGIKVFRGAGTHLMNGYSTVEEINANLKGAIVQDKGYMSTSAVKGHNFSDKILYEIDVKPGKGKGAFIAPISNFKKSEIEFLLARGSKFRVNGARNDSGQVVVSLTLQ